MTSYVQAALAKIDAKIADVSRKLEPARAELKEAYRQGQSFGILQARQKFDRLARDLVALKSERQHQLGSDSYRPSSSNVFFGGNF